MSVGIGRGRGRLPPANAEPPRRPGTGRGGMAQPAQLADLLAQTTVTTRNQSPADRLSNLAVSTVTFFDAIDSFLCTNPSDDEIRRVIQDILDKAISMPVNVDCISQCIYLASKHKKYGQKLITTFFAELQIKFEGRHKIRSSGEASYWRFCKFFSSVCYYTRNILYPPFVELIEALLELIKTPLQLSSSKDDTLLIEQMSTLAIAVVRYLSFSPVTDDSDDPATTRVRDIVYTSPSLEGIPLLWLLACLESVHSPTGASPRALRYYVPKLGMSAASLALTVPTVELSTSASAGNYSFNDIGYNIQFV